MDWNPITLDWAYQADWAVRQVDNWLVVRNVLDQTHNGIKPVDGILRALGGDPMFVEEMAGTCISVDVIASAPTMETIDVLYNELLPFFSSGEEYLDGYVSLFKSQPPWKPWSEEIAHFSWEYDSSRLFSGVLVRSDTQIELRNLDFDNLGYGLPGLLAYLRAKGCITVEYTFIVVE